MGQDCSKRFKGGNVYAHIDAEQAFKQYEQRLKQMRNLAVKSVRDDSDTACITAFEEQLNLRNVHLEEFEDRLKRFVFKIPVNRASSPNDEATIRKKQLQIAFEGNQYLEAMINDRSSLDWRLLMQDNIFVVFKDENDQFRDQESFEEDDDLTFKVDQLNLLGILYCKCEKEVRADRFYSFLQPGLEDSISGQDRDLEVFVPLMGRICYEAMINCFNQEHESQGSDKKRLDLIPTNDKLHILDEACRLVLEDDSIGFAERMFDVSTRVSQSVFKQKLVTENYNYLQPHSIRIMVAQQLKDLMQDEEDQED